MRIGEVSRILDIPVQTIRFYEQQGIVSPGRIGEGGYREYETWDLFYLGECMMYRNMGLTVGEIKKVLHQISFHQQFHRALFLDLRQPPLNTSG